MKVRAYDFIKDHYFISEVYALINTGYFEKYLVCDPYDGYKMKLIDFLDKREKTVSYSTNINIIENVATEEWIYRKIESSDECNSKLNTEDKERYIYHIGGFSRFVNNPNLIGRLILGEVFTASDFELTYNIDSMNKDGWMYIRNDENIKCLMEEFHGFHDSVLVDAKYISGASVDENKVMSPMETTKSLELRFESQWSRPIVLNFVGLIDFRLKPADDNHTGDLFDCSLFILNEILYFFTSHINEIDENFDGTWAKAYEVRWRYVKSNLQYF